MNLKKICILATLLLAVFFVKAQHPGVSKESFDMINLDYPGLEKVKKAVLGADYNKAAKELLTYYRNRTFVKHPDYKVAERNQFFGKPIAAADLEKAENALQHKFQPLTGYDFFDYGKDINWEYWPVKDNEVRWQLHRVYWWQSMGLAYRNSRDEKYAKEWVFQFRDWIRKNAYGHSQENDRFAWRPLEVSERIYSLPGTFNLFITSPNFTPDFLLEFLASYTQQADYILPHNVERGNHLLFEAQRVLFAGCFFPELKNSTGWRKDGIDILAAEINKQVYPDGLQFELAPAYHVASIELFLNGYKAAQMAGLNNEFPNSYLNTVENMIMAIINISFPDYQNPLFGDSFIVNADLRKKQFTNWSNSFPDNAAIKYFATDGKEGNCPNYLSKGLTTAGFYTFRNGWNKNSTAMVLKASPPGTFHAQPDNGSFELWVKGRNFTPDAGCYVYIGDAEINKLRDNYRQSKVHSTLTLDNRNMVITKAVLGKWEPAKNPEILTYTNPSYSDLNHRRTILFIDQTYFLIIDEAVGNATGNLGIHFQLKEDARPIFENEKNKVYTTYSDGNNLLIQCLNYERIAFSKEEGKISYAYRKEMKRPAFVFEKPKKTGMTQRFITVLYPFEGTKAPEISIKENAGNDYENENLNLTLSINGKKSTIVTGVLK